MAKHRQISNLSYFIFSFLLFFFFTPGLSFGAWLIPESPAPEPKADTLITYDPNGEVTSYEVYLYDQNNNLIRKTEYDDPGNDRDWFTEDDQGDIEINEYISKDKITKNVEYSSGPDGIPSLKEDYIEEIKTYQYDANGDGVKNITYNSAGPDGRWETNDDIIESYDLRSYNYSTYRVRELEYNDPGPDLKWFTADDILDEYDDYIFDSNFRYLKHFKYDGIGMDGIWFTGDDILDWSSERNYYPNGNLESHIESDGDEDYYFYNASNIFTRWVHKKSGETLGYYDFTYDSNNKMKEILLYFKPGPDGIWFDSDDLLYKRYVFEYSTDDIDKDGVSNSQDNCPIDYNPDQIDSDRDEIGDACPEWKQIGAFVARFYNLCLSRNPDQAGLIGWVSDLVDGTSTGADVAWGFVFSPEFLNKVLTNEEYLKILYEAFFKRQPDSAGLQGWIDAFANGASREDVLNGFIYATEFAELCEEYGIKAFEGHITKTQRENVEAFVTRFYQLCLDRDPDAAGLDGWADNLLNQIQTGADVAEGFIYSPEFIAQNTTDSEYLLILYQAFFGRDADPAGLQGWLDAIAAGTPREEVLDGFIYSTEFGQLCQKYGISSFR